MPENSLLFETEGIDIYCVSRTSKEERLKLRLYLAQRIQRIDLTFGATVLTAGPVKNVFLSERRKPLSRFTVCVLIKKYATAAGLGDLEIHPHMLRHACGYSLANRGADTRLIQDYLGHKNITHTVRYTKLAPGRFTGLF